MLLVLSVVFSCSMDTELEESATQPESRISQYQFDNSYLGVYKGVFTTNDGLTRGNVHVTLSPSGEGIAQITLSSGELVELKSKRLKLSVDNMISNLRFSSEGLNELVSTFDFSVEGNGANPIISNVFFDNKDSNVLIAKNLSRAPLAPITGTYVRTSGTNGFPINGLTWNIMAIGAGNGQNFALQVSYGGRVYTSASTNNLQTNCIDGSQLTTCDIGGNIRLLGYDVNWFGTHSYSLSGSEMCSSMSGSWSSPSYGGSSGTFTSDVDPGACIVEGPTLPEVVIGTQTWMQFNLDVETYRNGDPIPQVQNQTEWLNLTTGAWCYYNNNSSFGPTYGKLYNAYALRDPRGLAPEGWHIPNDTEFNTLSTFLGGSAVAGREMKSATEWGDNSTNSSGFNGLPGGYRNAIFGSRGSFGFYWSANSNSSNDLQNYYYLSFGESLLGNDQGVPVAGLSVRCIKN